MAKGPGRTFNMRDFVKIESTAVFEKTLAGISWGGRDQRQIKSLKRSKNYVHPWQLAKSNTKSLSKVESTKAIYMIFCLIASALKEKKI